MNNLKIAFFISCLLSSACSESFATHANTPRKEVPQTKEGLTYSYAPVVKKVAPAVVNIYTVKQPKTKVADSPFLEDPFFKQFLERMYPGFGREQVALGSGVIINKEGYILTNYHVVKNADSIQVAMSDKRQFTAKPVVTDKRTDLALLKIEAKEALPYLNVAPQENLEVGDIVLAIGNPFGIGQTVSTGIVSALARNQDGIGDIHSFIQTDAAINPGNSGGALITTDGRLIGINTAIYSKSGGSVGIGFAIPTALAMPIIESLKTGGRIVRSWIGLDVVPITTKMAQSLGLERPYGVLVKGVYPEGPAYQAGLKQGDIILSIDKNEIGDKDTLDYRVAISPLGTQSTIKFSRQGELKTVPIHFVKPPEGDDPHPFAIEGKNPLEGAKLRVLSPALALELGLNPMKTGVVITEVAKEGIAAQIGALPGDILLSVNKNEVSTKEDARALLQANPAVWELLLLRDKKLVKLNVKGG